MHVEYVGAWGRKGVRGCVSARVSTSVHDYVFVITFFIIFYGYRYGVIFEE